MKIQNKIIPLCIILLFIVGIYGQTQQTSFSFNQDLSKQVQLTEGNVNLISNNNQPSYKTFSQVTSGRTTLTTDADSYAPGDWVTVTAESDTDEMNGSLEWRLESPISEISFDFESYYQDVLADPNFDSGITDDWENDGFEPLSAADGYLNLTEVADLDLADIEVYNNDSALEINNKYRVTFDYYPQGENMLVNPSFETGNTSNWVSVGTLENVSAINDPTNASDGSYYANINATVGFILNQTVPINGQSDGRSFTFTVRATGNTNANYWISRLEAVNSSGHVIGVKSAADSRNFEVDEKGYVTVMFEWKLPANATSIKAIFLGQDTGDDADGYYTGWVDNCILAEAPSALDFSYAADGKWNNNTLITESQEWHTAEYIFETFDTLPSPSTKTLRFILRDSNSYANNKTSYWLIDNIAVNIVSKHEELTGPISNVENRFEGFVNSTWFHQGYREELSSTYKIDIESPENTSVASETQAEIKIQLPTHQVYMGSWIVVFKIHQIDTGEPPTKVQTKTINISFVVEEPINFVIQDYYLLRGSTNKTENNVSVFTEYFVQETGIEAISPRDNITVLGYLEANSTPTEWYDLEYLTITAALTSYLWESNWKSEEIIYWDVFGVIPYNTEGESVINGNFTSPLNNSQTVGINFQVPNRGIFGNITGNLSLSLMGTNVKPDGVGDPLLSLVVPITLPRVEFRINVTEEHIPETSFWLTDYFGGNITLEFLNINNTLEANYTNRNISSVLDIPITDVDLRLFLDETGTSLNEIDITQEFHYHYIGNTIIWFDFIDPNIKSGNYTFRIRWNTAYSQNASSFAEVAITQSAVLIRGTLEIVTSSTLPTVKQGEQLVINFTIQLTETLKRIGGLDLISSLADNVSEGNLIVYEQQGVYYVDLVVNKTMEAKNYLINIFVSGSSDAIGSIEFTVVERESEQSNQLNLFDVLISIGGFGIFVALGVATVGLMFRINKS
ncbi:hypothetical protein CEE45_15055 [Candidatus Heimdallarchaeota archaeon B3_Heim]|nr:MAG: hypothetical protein CEE45_15055 [Candidatus Heimdallarchaeota archaeon B3_Heim]